MFFPVPDFKGFDFFPHNLRLPFMRYKGICLVLSLIFMAASLGLYFTRGLNYGVDFVGGSLVEVQHKNGPADLSAMREKLNALGIGSVQIQSFGADTDVLIRVEQQKGGEVEQQAAMKKVVDALGPEYTQRRIEVVGPAVSSELRRTGLIAVLASLVAISIYVWFRFEWQFGVGALIALLHDVLCTVGLFVLLRLDFSLTALAALLTIAGYSINDTVVIFDRVRENMRRYKKMGLIELLNFSINETLARTLMTSGTVFVAVLALVLFGGPVLYSFSVAMLWGVIVGTYSSIWVACAGLVYLNLRPDQLRLDEEKAEKAKA